MKSHLTAILSAFAFSFVAPAAVAGDNVVLVELFSSQGCSSCPPADKNLAEIAGRDDVLGLALHVDYWDYLGWRDTFARPAHTERQLAYRELMGLRVIYTPQMIVQGMKNVPGSRTARLNAAIAEAQAVPSKATITISENSGMLKATLATEGEVTPCTVWMASFERERTVQIARGENAGRKITYSNVVDKLMRVGAWDGTTQEIALPQPDMGGGVAIWLQDDRTGRVLTASFVER